MGEPGSGKGTLARLCEKKLGYRVLSTGELLRRHIAEQTELGKEVEAYLKEGRLVPDEMITSMVGEWLSHAVLAEKPIILDGYPRTTIQADMFLALLQEQFPQHNYVVLLVSLPHEEIVHRLAKRIVCSNKSCQATFSTTMFERDDNLSCLTCKASLVRRPDDAEDVVRKRLTVYELHHNEVVSFYKEKNVCLKTLPVSGLSINEVFESFVELIEGC